MSLINRMNVGNTDYDIQDRLMPDAIGQAGQVLKVKDDGSGLEFSTIESGGEKVSLTFPAGASEGTITAEQLVKLQASESNYIEMVNDKELYYLNDPGHVEGYLTYSHVGIENGKATIKTLTITVSAKSFVIVTTVVPTDAGGGKLYKHYTSLVASVGPATLNLYVYSISPISKAYDDISVIPLYFISGIHKDPSNYFVVMEIIRNNTKLKVHYLSASNGRLEIEQNFNILTDNLTEL